MTREALISSRLGSPLYFLSLSSCSPCHVHEFLSQHGDVELMASLRWRGVVLAQRDEEQHGQRGRSSARYRSWLNLAPVRHGALPGVGVTLAQRGQERKALREAGRRFHI